jgi:hypothetical protein
MLSYQYKDYYSEQDLSLLNHLEAAGVDIDSLVAVIADSAYRAGFRDGEEYQENYRAECSERYQDWR